mmetsp:Transcript_18953/g.44965  ORF Transcript_18953/g.44965 Transcript_18953/m.44965 type:complete len:318 (-) Transcript_18953:85-1038(-)
MTAQVSGGIEYTGGPKFNIDDDFRASSQREGGDAALGAARAAQPAHGVGLVAGAPEGLGLQLGHHPILLGLAVGDLLELTDPQLVEPAHAQVGVAEVASQPAVARVLAHHGDGLGRRVVRDGHLLGLVREDDALHRRSLELQAGEQVGLLLRLAAVVRRDDLLEHVAEPRLLEHRDDLRPGHAAAHDAGHLVLVERRQPVDRPGRGGEVGLGQHACVGLAQLGAPPLRLAPVVRPLEGLLDGPLRQHAHGKLHVIIVRRRQVVELRHGSPRLLVQLVHAAQHRLVLEHGSDGLHGRDAEALNLHEVRLKQLVQVARA